MNSKVGKVITYVTIVIGLIAGFWKFEDRYATAGSVAKEINELQQDNVVRDKEIKALGIRLEIKTLSDYRDNLQERVWKLDDRYGIGCAECEPEILSVYIGIVTDIEKLDGKLKALEGGK